MAAGFFAVVLLMPDPNRQLLEDLPVLENLDEYRQIDDIEFLRMLRDAGLFREAGRDAGPGRCRRRSNRSPSGGSASRA